MLKIKIPGRNKSFPAFYVIYDALEFRNHSFSTAVYAAQICKSFENRLTLAGKKEKHTEYREDNRDLGALVVEIDGVQEKAINKTKNKQKKNRPSTASSSWENPMIITAQATTARSKTETTEAGELETAVVGVNSRDINAKAESR